MKKIYKETLIIVLILLITIVTILILNKGKTDTQEILVEENIIQEEIIENDNCLVKVDIKGNIKVPGMYTVDCELRIQDIIDLSGGLINDSDTSNINLSKKVFDEMVIIIPSYNDIENSIELNNDAVIDEKDLATNERLCDTPVDSSVSINNGTLEELMTIPGIGKSKAEKIIEYRNNSPFTSIEDIMNVSGIGNTIYEKIKAYIKL